MTPTLRLTRFRRPTATANEAKVASTNWTAGPGDVPTGLANTVNGAARFHAQRPDTVPLAQQIAARDFQLGIFFAQTVDKKAGRLERPAPRAARSTWPRSRSTSASTT